MSPTSRSARQGTSAPPPSAGAPPRRGRGSNRRSRPTPGPPAATAPVAPTPAEPMQRPHPASDASPLLRLVETERAVGDLDPGKVMAEVHGPVDLLRPEPFAHRGIGPQGV